jgi:hypothetical protein
MKFYPSKLATSFLVLGLLIGCSEDRVTTPNQDPIQGNHDPVIAQQADTSAIVGDTLRLEFAAIDEDEDSLHFEQEILVSWGDIKAGYWPIADIDSHKGSFWFYPHTYDMPARQVTVMVSDGHGGLDSTTFSVTVGLGY